MIKEAILLAGGLGTRLQAVVPELPKPMAPVNGRPFIEYVLDHLIANNVRRFILSVGYKHQAFVSHFADDYKNCQILFSVENEPLGTGGAIKKAMEYAENEDVLVLNADTFFRVDISSFGSVYNKAFPDIAVALRQMNDVGRYGCVQVNENMQITGFAEKNESSGSGFINGGMYIMKKNIFNALQLPDKFSIEKDFLEKYYNRLIMRAFPSNAFFLDIGIPEDYEKAQHAFKRF